MADILVVEDNIDIADAMALMLEDDGFHVRVAHDGATALHAAEQAKPDIVVIDIGLPVLNGLEVARQLTRMYGDVSMIACTGYADDLTRRQLVSAGFARTLAKPVPIGQLLDAVRELIRPH